MYPELTIIIINKIHGHRLTRHQILMYKTRSWKHSDGKQLDSMHAESNEDSEMHDVKKLSEAGIIGKWYFTGDYKNRRLKVRKTKYWFTGLVHENIQMGNN